MPQMSFGAVAKITGLRPGVCCKIVHRFISDGFNVIRHRSRNRMICFKIAAIFFIKAAFKIGKNYSMEWTMKCLKYCLIIVIK